MRELTLGKDSRLTGESHPRAKLTIKDVNEIRCLYPQGVSGCKLARMYGVHPTTVMKIVNGTSWKTPQAFAMELTESDMYMVRFLRSHGLGKILIKKIMGVTGASAARMISLSDATMKKAI